MSVIESRLEKAEEAADLLLKEAYPEDQPVPSGDTPAPAIPPIPEPGKTVEPAAGEKGVVVEDGEAGKKKVDGEPPVPGTPPASVPDPYEQKFKVLEGKYKAEVPRLSSELAQWKEYAATLTSRITALEEAAKSAPAPATPADAEPDFEVDAFVADNPGAKKLIEKIRAEHKAELAAVREEIKAASKKGVEAVSEIRQTTAIDRFEKSMSDAGVSDWRTIDSDPAFAEWLNRSPYNVKVLSEAASSFDAKTVAAYFLDYKKSLNPQPDPANVTDPEPPDSPAPNSKLEKNLAPPRGSNNLPPANKGAQPALTKDNYSKFMKQTTLGKYKPTQWGGKTEEQMEAIFDAAIAKGELV